PEGVYFPATVSAATVLDGFQIDRAAASPTTAGVTVDGATNVTLSGLRISNDAGGMSSYGVSLVNGAEAIITRSSITGGTGSVESIGVRSVGATPSIQDNCLSLDAAGHCDDVCNGCADPGLCGRLTTGSGEAYAVLLEDSPGAVVETSAMCGNDADEGAGLRIRGDATGTVVRANFVNAWGGAADSHGIWMEDCAGAAPWVVDNFAVQAAGDSATTAVDAVRAIGDCHPVIDSNLSITGGGEGGTSGTNGVHCGANLAGVASACVVLGNLSIHGSSFGFPPTAVGVRCDGDGCNRIANNVILGNGGVDVWGVVLESTGAVIESNDITGGCGSVTTTGLYAADSFARLENNVIRGGACNLGAASSSTFVALYVAVDGGPNEIDVHSNDIDGVGQMNPSCTSTGVVWDWTGGTMPTAGIGIFRNNIVRAGVCGNNNVFVETVPAADPRLFESNDLDPTGAPLSIYFDEGTTGLTTAAAVDALTVTIASGTLSSDALFAGYPTDLHLTAASPCVGAGTPVGAPLTDFEGDPRDPATPDIGADEL
ncbi:MAG TPA: hypothetical protein VG389_06130, partial [Myxococcota bacterium]|nr:hypothetical protein [Myxococcota bacterium]